MGNVRALRPLSKLPLLTVETISIIYGDTDPELIAETLEQFKAEAADYVTNISKLRHSGALEEIIRYVHSLKTMSAMVGAEKMSRVCQVFERQLRARDMIEVQRTYPMYEKIWVETLQQLDQYLAGREGAATHE